MLAIGFRAHTGWAAAVAIDGAKPHVVDRSRVPLAETADTEALQAYHQAAELPFARAAQHIAAARRAANACATASITALLARLPRVSCVAIVAANAALPASLEKILASHALIHAAEGQLFRDAIATACKTARLSIVEIPGRQLDDHPLRARADALGKGLGTPWARDQKDCALAAWIALHAK